MFSTIFLNHWTLKKYHYGYLWGGVLQKMINEQKTLSFSKQFLKFHLMTLARCIHLVQSRWMINWCNEDLFNYGLNEAKWTKHKKNKWDETENSYKTDRKIVIVELFLHFFLLKDGVYILFEAYKRFLITNNPADFNSLSCNVKLFTFLWRWLRSLKKENAWICN